MILLSSGRMDSKTIRQALVAFTLMERYLVHFEDNYRSMYQQAARQLLRDNNELGPNNLGSSPLKGNSPLKQSIVMGSGSNTDNTGMLPVFNKAKSIHGASIEELQQEVDLICICGPQEKQKAVFKVPKEHNVHANIECPFRRLNRVQKWQLKQTS